MAKKLISFVTVFALTICLGGMSALARTGSDPKDPKDPKVNPAPAAEKKKADEKLKADMAKLVSDTKAGKFKMPAQHFPPPHRNNLSKGAKIAIVAGIAGAVIFIILWYTTGPGSD